MVVGWKKALCGGLLDGGGALIENGSSRNGQLKKGGWTFRVLLRASLNDVTMSFIFCEIYLSIINNKIYMYRHMYIIFHVCILYIYLCLFCVFTGLYFLNSFCLSLADYLLFCSCDHSVGHSYFSMLDIFIDSYC